MCRVPALMYFGRLDAGITKEVGDEAAYPWVSLVIELRACWLYEIYQDVLERSGVALSLKALAGRGRPASGGYVRSMRRAVRDAAKAQRV
jgi:hypothetical protein